MTSRETTSLPTDPTPVDQAIEELFGDDATELDDEDFFLDEDDDLDVDEDE